MVAEFTEILGQVESGIFRRGGEMKSERFQPPRRVLSTIHDTLLARLHILIITEIIDSLSEVVSFKQTNKKVNGTL